ncbi:hypothetical protein BpHYR1_006367 [Brachionus plicatilis]|uniref:RING-type domain-containing protein n=1 Tax=Brachionus plicatilis TaxID=10195 RepID=A0A3M7S9Q5_BRAPC|nr:hypothetical protein BpHYR1_006367 [Brachionus plicatilis]
MICEFCGKEDSVQIVLSCGYTVCLEHVNNLGDTFQCIICKNHVINKQALFNMNKNRSILSKLQFTNYLNTVKEKCF